MKDILEKALSLVTGDRAEQHGDYIKTHRKVAALWSAFLGVEISASKVPLMLALLKMARADQGKYNPDDYVDLAGYGAIAGAIARDAEKHG